LRERDKRIAEDYEKRIWEMLGKKPIRGGSQEREPPRAGRLGSITEKHVRVERQRGTYAKVERGGREHLKIISRMRRKL